MTGFIAMQRDALDHPIIGEPERFYAFFWLVGNACWKPKRIRAKGGAIQLERGELSYSVRYLADAWGWSKSRVDRFLAELRKEGMIAPGGTVAGRSAGQQQSIITICNYDKYQGRSEGAWDGEARDAGHGWDTDGTNKNKENKETNTPNGVDIPCAREAEPFPCPDWCDPEVWRDLKHNRKQKRLANTATAHRSFLAKVEELAEDGWPPGEVVRQIAAKGWGGAYDPRDNHKNQGNQRNGASGGSSGDGAIAELERRRAARSVGSPASATERPPARPGRGVGQNALPAPAGL